ncbi:hypothetical protein ABT404_26245 [Streptomyces hyaluromycini]|uniref:Uncharacterized protein n=1 Tax=Streptomyces hyaluromycini TaxID=1377993 RepID=A0ABV1X1P0_9ACTN
MGRQKPSKPRRERPEQLVTHEPPESLPGWPESHVSVGLTDDNIDECVNVVIHGVEHRLHATTARALSDALLKTLDAYNDQVRVALADPAVRALLPRVPSDELIV